MSDNNGFEFYVRRDKPGLWAALLRFLGLGGWTEWQEVKVNDLQDADRNGFWVGIVDNREEDK